MIQSDLVLHGFGTARQLYVSSNSILENVPAQEQVTVNDPHNHRVRSIDSSDTVPQCP